ncbi:MAG: glycoside hydrolase family 2 TIM barrel-domain containing protein [Lachnospiraceae bacterium]|nr:glycoside hydrolase family 2 TIM barrel-domain containing protein [Lachnospiraceae bacterium]
MKRLFNGGWSFWCGEPDLDVSEAGKHLTEFQKVDLPHDWLIADAKNLYRDGCGFYRNFFSMQPKENKRYSLIFEGVYMDTTIWVNEQQAGEWKYGYSTFEIDLTPFVKAGENEILVSVNFRSPNSRWYSGAGIYRDVWFKETSKTYIRENGVYVHTEACEEKDGEAPDFLLYADTEIVGDAWDEVRHTLYVKREVEPEIELPFELLLGDEVELVGEASLVTGKASHNTNKNTAIYRVKSPKLWDVEHPNLYILKTELWKDGEVIQEEYSQIGFRSIAFDPEQGFLLNGRKVKLNGVCEHHDLGALGAAFHRTAMARKFRILKEMGVNALRGTHNMTAPAVVELADQMGILMISEAFDMWERSKTTYDYARFFKEWSERDVESWVMRDRNHPSVIMFSIGNEIYDTHVDAHGREITVRLRDLVKRYDYRGNAGITIGSNYMPWENAQHCAEEVKLAGYNYGEKYYEEHHKAHPDWVIYGSETSSIVQSRGIYHFPLRASILTEDDEQCSSLGNSPTSWGAKSMERCVCEDRDMDFSMGQFLWTGFDYIGEPTPYHTKNSYFGQVDTAGFPKDAYYVWQSAWTDYRKAPMIHIFPYWDFNEGQSIDVRVCSNAPFVELFCNGKSCGRQRLTHEKGSGHHIIADYALPYEKGVLYAIAYDEAGKVTARETKASFGNSAEIVLQASRRAAVANGRDLFFVEIGTRDERGNPVENAVDRVTVRVEGAGRLVGLDNGDSTDEDSYKGNSRQLFSGKLLAIIETGMIPGAVRIRVSGKGLKSVELVCEAVEMDQMLPFMKGEEAQRIYREVFKDPFAENDDSGQTELTEDYEERQRERQEDEQKQSQKEQKQAEIPVRKITLHSPMGQKLSKEQPELTVEAEIEPKEATDRQLIFRVVDEHGVDSNLVKLLVQGHTAQLQAMGDGSFYLRCMSRSGTDGVRVISQLEFTVEGMGQAYRNPYELISGSLYTSYQGEVSNGNERGVATARDGETVVTFGNIDFGPVGSDEITMPIFALTSEEYPIRIYEGVPGEEGCQPLADVVYQKPSIWNTYQEETYSLAKRVTGINTISIAVHQKIHLKGFVFKKLQKAWLSLNAEEADSVYGDTFTKEEHAITGIGNNVTITYTEMDFGEEGTAGVRICGRAPESSNSLHIRFSQGEEEIKQLVEFPMCGEYTEKAFSLTPVKGKWDVSFVFLPGSCFDLQSVQFLPAGTEVHF